MGFSSFVLGAAPGVGEASRVGDAPGVGEGEGAFEAAAGVPSSPGCTPLAWLEGGTPVLEEGPVGVACGVGGACAGVGLACAGVGVACAGVGVAWTAAGVVWTGVVEVAVALDCFWGDCWGTLGTGCCWVVGGMAAAVGTAGAESPGTGNPGPLGWEGSFPLHSWP